ncbi:SRPBCC family protein [Micrococcus lacusdianchii]|uniref:SRPBCC family protein n=1 Tax=Micrococcus lacusdianchii TaxID=2915940 RepID=UPI0020043347|nr:SRPBCC family protein [Micrococcus sp. JXJ CY 30]
MDIPSSASPVDDARHPSDPAAVRPSAAVQAGWPERVDAGPHRVAYRHTVAAPAEELWAMLADPHRHHEVDGSGTVQATVVGPHRLAAGDRFTVAMRKFGVPYRMTNTVTEAEASRVIEWRHPAGHRWRWEFLDAGEGVTEVTETFDYSWARPAVRRAYELLRVPADNGRGIQSSLTRLAGRHL